MNSILKVFVIVNIIILNICVKTVISTTSIRSDLSKDDYLDDFEFEKDTNENSTPIELPLFGQPEVIIEDDLDLKNKNIEEENGFFPIKKKLIKNAVTKSLTHKELSQKFVEVIPILRVLSSQQKIALSSLISAQISAKPGTELKLSQVRSLFGNNQKLILPLVLDIANMVRNAAKSAMNYKSEISPPTQIVTTQKISTTENDNSNRRVFQQPKKSDKIENQRLDYENFQNDELLNEDDSYYGEIMDPIIINNELYNEYQQNNETTIEV